MNENSLLQASNITAETSFTGHNLPNTDELLNRIDDLENKIQSNPEILSLKIASMS